MASLERAMVRRKPVRYMDTGLSSLGWSQSRRGFLLRDIILRSAASTMVRGLHSVFRKFTKSCFCCAVKPMLKRWS